MDSLFGLFSEEGGGRDSDIILGRGLSKFGHFGTWQRGEGGPKTGKKIGHNLWMTLTVES